MVNLAIRKSMELEVKLPFKRVQFRLDVIEEKMNGLEEKMTGLKEDMDQRFKESKEEMDQRFESAKEESSQEFKRVREEMGAHVISLHEGENEILQTIGHYVQLAATKSEHEDLVARVSRLEAVHA